MILDKDDNDLLTLDELEKGMDLLKVNLSQEILSLLLKTFSKTYQDKMTYTEFLILMRWLYDNYEEEFVSVRKYIDTVFPVENDIVDYPEYYRVNIQKKEQDNYSEVYMKQGVGPLCATYNNSYDHSENNYTNALVAKLSNKSPSMKMSSFMANHLRKRIDGCNNVCDGLATDVVYNFRSGTCTNSHLLESLVLLNMECLENVSYMRIVRHNNKNAWALNNNLSYVSQYGIHNGEYSILSVPIFHPVTLLNKGKEHLITLTGNKATGLVK